MKDTTKLNKFVTYEQDSYTVNQRYDATAVDKFAVYGMGVTIEVTSHWVVEAKVKIGKFEHQFKQDGWIAKKLWSWMWALREKVDQDYRNEWLEATDGEFDRDPMGEPWMYI